MKVIKIFSCVLAIVCTIVILCRAMCFVYPKKYEASVKKYARMYDIDEELIFSVIKAESDFDKSAVSKKGAVGLMQIMEDTAAWVSDRIGISDFSKDNLFLPDKNIEIGAYYLSYLLDLYDDDVKCALAAYNAGLGNVDEWLKDTQYSPDGKTLQKIPFPETEKYVKKAQRYIKIYELLY